MNIRCPHCQTMFRVSPDRIPAGGVRARCARCGETFLVTRPVQADMSTSPPRADSPASPSKAERLARALVSDIVAYHPERLARSYERGNLRTEFRDEIMKSWEEYVAQVGIELAKSTPYFRDALNTILAKGQKVF